MGILFAILWIIFIGITELSIYMLLPRRIQQAIVNWLSNL